MLKRPNVNFDGVHCPMCGSDKLKKVEKDLPDNGKDITYYCDDCPTLIAFAINNKNEKYGPVVVSEGEK